jgi:hypothetical protein
MAKKAATENTINKTGKNHDEVDDPSVSANDNWEDSSDNAEYDERWLNVTAREKERSRIQRQMKARRELERLRDEKRLQQLVSDWPFED